MKRILWLLLLIISLASNAQQEEGSRITWQKNVLTWDDFQGTPVKSPKYEANTNTGLSYSWNLKASNGITELTYEVQSYFNRHLSWVVPGAQSEYLLEHEQLHFDISELFARKLRKKLAHVPANKLGRKVKEVLNSYYRDLQKERDIMQNTYDRDSNHGLDKKAQAQWQEFVKKELNKLQDYQSLSDETSVRAISNSDRISFTI